MSSPEFVPFEPVRSPSRVPLGALLGGLVLAAAALLGFVLFGAGAAEPGGASAAPTPLGEAEAVPAQSDQPIDDSVTEVLPVITYDVFLARDPFEPVVPEEPEPEPEPEATENGDDPADPADPTDPTDPTSPTSPTTPTDPTSPTSPTTPTDPSDPDDPACTGRTELVCDGRVVTLQRVTTDASGNLNAVIQIDEVVYQVPRGVVFAEYFEVGAFVDETCVLLVYGGDTFRLCPGETVLK